MNRHERMDWNRQSQAFRYFDGTLPEPQAERREYTASDVRFAMRTGTRMGWISATAVITILIVGAKLLAMVVTS